MKLRRWNCATSAGTTADAENHSAMAPTWQIAMIAIDMRFDAIAANSRKGIRSVPSLPLRSELPPGGRVR